MDITQDGIELQKAWEGFRTKKYQDGNGYSIGYGTHIDEQEEQYLLGVSLTKEEASSLLLKDNRTKFIPYIQKYIKVPLTQQQLNGLLGLVYNVGPQCLYINGKTTGLCNAINAKNSTLIAAKFRAYNKVRVKGVLTTSSYQTKRREADLTMFMTGKIVYPDGTVKSPTELGQTIVFEEATITTLQYVLGVVLILVSGVLAYRNGYFKHFFPKKKDGR